MAFPRYRSYGLVAILAGLMMLALVGQAWAVAGIGVAVGPNSNPVHVGDSVFYTVIVSNIGTVELTDVSVFFYPPTPDGLPSAFGPTGLACAPGVGFVTVDSGLTLAVGGTTVYPAVGPFPANANAGISTLAMGAQACGNSVEGRGGATFSNFLTVLAPCLSVTKRADVTVSKCGDLVNYTITVTNCSPTTELASWTVNDSILGDLIDQGYFPITPPAPGETLTATIPYVVGSNPADNCASASTLTNTVTVTGLDSLAGSACQVWPTIPPTEPDCIAEATIDLVHPAISITKTGPEVCVPPGGTANYTITITNTGDVDLENVVVTDTLTGAVAFPSTLAVGESQSVGTSYTVLPGDPDPFVNTATVHADPAAGDLTNDITASASFTTDVCQSGIAITKVADPLVTKTGDTVTYTICITNTGETTLVDVTVDDTLLGPLAGFPTTLAPGQSACADFTRTTLAGDPDPIVNTATVNGTIEGTATVLTDSASAEVDVIHPSFSLNKRCAPDPVAVGATLTWTILLENTGDVSLDITTVDPTAGINQTDTVAAGASLTITATHVVAAGDASPITNTATATAVLTSGLLPNVILPSPDNGSSSCDIEVLGGPTRTQGYWFTHPRALRAAFACITGSESGTITLCAGCTVNANGAMKIFWKRTGGNSNLATQILAAMFNQCMFGTPAPAGIIDAGLAVLCDPNATAEQIGAATAPLDAFNQSGDLLPFPAGFPTGPANTTLAKAMAAAGTVPSCITGNAK